jgi:hypothetical protein
MIGHPQKWKRRPAGPSGAGKSSNSGESRRCLLVAATAQPFVISLQANAHVVHGATDFVEPAGVSVQCHKAPPLARDRGTEATVVDDLSDLVVLHPLTELGVVLHGLEKCDKLK